MACILAIRAYNHDSGTVLLKDGVPVIALEEERWSRKRREGRFPESCINFLKDDKLMLKREIKDVVFPYDSRLFCHARWHAFKRYFPAGDVNLASIVKRH